MSHMVPIHREAGVSYAWKKPEDGHFLPVEFQRRADGPQIRPEWRGVWGPMRTVWILLARRRETTTNVRGLGLWKPL